MGRHLDTLMREWEDFDRRNPEVAALQVGGLTWGLLRAIAECPDCPGSFRVPVDAAQTLWRCGRCGGVWRWEGAAAAAADAAERARRDARLAEVARAVAEAGVVCDVCGAGLAFWPLDAPGPSVLSRAGYDVGHARGVALVCGEHRGRKAWYSQPVSLYGRGGIARLPGRVGARTR
jgi:hypothetical protein